MRALRVERYRWPHPNLRGLGDGRWVPKPLLSTLEQQVKTVPVPTLSPTQ